MRKIATFGLSTAGKRPQIPLNDARGLVKGSIESSWAGEEVSRSPEVTRGLHHTLGRGQSWGLSNRLIGVVGVTENDLKSQRIVMEGPSRAQTRAPQAGKRFHVPWS